MELYKIKEQSYFSSVREDIISCLPQNSAQKILEIGAGSGDTLCRIKQLGLAHEVVGFELMEIADSNQNNPLIDKIYFGDIEKESPPFENGYFDVIICGDVLEHLHNPWGVLENLTKFLKVGGTVIISLPNIRHFTALSKIFLRGSFAYDERGLFDKTHLRFFCKQDMINLVKSSGLSLVEVSPYFKKSPKAKKIKLVNNLTLGLFSDLLAGQYILIGKK